MSRKGSIEDNIEHIKRLPITGEQPKTEREEAFLREVCEFEFNNLEEPGLSHKWVMGNTKNNFTFHFFHGGKYRVPRFVARHLEECTTPLWKWLPDGTGRMDKKLVGTKSRFQMKQTFADAA